MTHYQILQNTRWITNDFPLDVLKKIACSIDSGEDCEIIRSGYFKKVLKYTHNQASFYIKLQRRYEITVFPVKGTERME